MVLSLNSSALKLFLFCSLLLKVKSRTIICSESSPEDEKVVHFKSVGFPGFQNEDVSCEVVIKLSNNFKGVRVDFVNVTMDGQSLIGSASFPGNCESDMFFFRGFDGWTPPARCGKLAGYSFFIDKSAGLKNNELKIVALMSGPGFRWDLRISKFTDTQTSKEAKERQRSRRKSSRVQSIMHGVSTNILSVPYLVSIRREKLRLYNRVGNCEDLSYEKEHFCGGTIIGDRFVLTAAKCFYPLKKFDFKTELQDIRVVVGDSYVCKNDSMGSAYLSEQHEIKSVVLHSGYDPMLAFHDVAVVVLKKPIQFAPHVQPIKLNSVEDYGKKVKGMVSGFGAWDLENSGYYVNRSTFLNFNTNVDYFPFEPQTLNLTLEASEVCSYAKINNRFEELYRVKPLSEMKKYSHISKSIRCAVVPNNVRNATSSRGSEGSTGFRDQGGPFVVLDESDGILKLGGIILQNEQIVWNTERRQIFFSSVAYYRQWINYVMESY